MTLYKNTTIPEKTPSIGVRRFPRGKYRGMYQAFQIDADHTTYQGEPRATYAEALADIDFAMEVQGPARVYSQEKV